MNITSYGRPLGSCPLLKLRDGEGGFLLVLSRIDIDVSDIGKPVEAHYTAFFRTENRDGMKTCTFRFFDAELILFFTQRGIQHHVHRTNQATEE